MSTSIAERMRFFTYGDKELEYLKTKDKKLKAVIDRYGMIQREVSDSLFEALISSIVSQQISSKAAISVWQRLVAAVDGVSKESIEKATVEEIHACGMSMRKAQYIKGIGEAVSCGALDLDMLATMSDEEVVQHLAALKGIGRWTAEMLMIFSMERMDILSWDDLAIRRGLMRLYHHKSLTKEQFMRYRKRYAPYNSVASLYLWALSAE